MVFPIPERVMLMKLEILRIHVEKKERFGAEDSGELPFKAFRGHGFPFYEFPKPLAIEILKQKNPIRACLSNRMGFLKLIIFSGVFPLPS